jgi:hypothetical protein
MDMHVHLAVSDTALNFTRLLMTPRSLNLLYAVPHSEATLRALVTDICAAARDQGFEHVVIVNSHFEPEHVATLRRAADQVGAAFFDLTRRRAAERRVLAGTLRQAVLPAGNPHTGGEPPEVPFPRAGMRLVEIVQVENQVSFRRGVEPEVAQVGVATNHRLDAGARQTGEILSHERCSTAQKCVRRRQHPADPKGDQAFETP